jgi:hypothetical protein
VREGALAAGHRGREGRHEGEARHLDRLPGSIDALLSWRARLPQSRQDTEIFFMKNGSR